MNEANKLPKAPPLPPPMTPRKTENDTWLLPCAIMALIPTLVLLMFIIFVVHK